MTLDFDKAGGLITAVVQDHASGRVLMVGYMNEEAFRKTVHDEVEKTLAAIGASHGQGQWKKKLLVKDRIAEEIEPRDVGQR